MNEIQTGASERWLRITSCPNEETLTGADPAVLWLRVRQLCFLGGHAHASGEIIGIVQKLKDDISADLADSQKS